MKELILKMMRSMPVREQRLLYRYAYILVIANKFRHSKKFEKEPFPPTSKLSARTREIMEYASESEMRKIYKMCKALYDRKKGGTEK